MHAGNVARGLSTQCKFCGWAATREKNLARANVDRNADFVMAVESGEKLHAIACDYGVSYITVWRATRHLRKRLDVSRCAT